MESGIDMPPIVIDYLPGSLSQNGKIMVAASFLVGSGDDSIY
jgi:hypothetical protein